MTWLLNTHNLQSWLPPSSNTQIIPLPPKNLFKFEFINPSSSTKLEEMKNLFQWEYATEI